MYTNHREIEGGVKNGRSVYDFVDGRGVKSVGRENEGSTISNKYGNTLKQYRYGWLRFNDTAFSEWGLKNKSRLMCDYMMFDRKHDSDEVRTIPYTKKYHHTGSRKKAFQHNCIKTTTIKYIRLRNFLTISLLITNKLAARKIVSK